MHGTIWAFEKVFRWHKCCAQLLSCSCMKPQYSLQLLLVPLFFLLIYFQIFYTDFAYLDEIHQL